MIRYTKDTDNIVTLRLDMRERPVNIINHEIGRAFVPVLQHLKAEKAKGQLRGVILTSDKRSFLAGGDLDYLHHCEDAATIFNYSETLKHFFRELERPGVPVVAAINGTALGSGFELALACHYRIAINDSSSQIGLPEVTLGLMPGSGGTVRLLWYLGFQKAFPILIEGRRHTPLEALEAGLVDALADDEEEMLQKAKDWLLHHAEGRQPWDRPAYQIPGGAPHAPQVAQRIAAAAAQLVRDKQYNYPAQHAILNALAEAGKLDFDTACRVESRYFTQLLLDARAKNMTRALWYDVNAIKGDSNRPRGFGKFRPRKVGIIGAGAIGSGVAYLSALRGMEVVLKDISKAVAERGKHYAAERLDEQVRRGKLTPAEKKAVLERIRPTQSAEDFENCDLIFEAVFENAMVKAKVTKEAEAYIDEYAFTASNTSMIPITELARASQRPERFIGMRFLSPVDTEPLVEVIRGEQTSAETLAQAYDFAKKIRKTPILIKDNPGFYVARVQNIYVLEGVAMLQEGIPATLIEHMGRRIGMPSGPLELADRISLKVAYNAERQAADHYGQKYQQHPAVAVLEDMIEARRSGKFNGAGFYDYADGEKTGLWAGLTEKFPPTEGHTLLAIQERLLFAQAIEAVWCFQEGIISSVADANVGSIYGWGFPAYLGGILQYINGYGIEAFVARSKQYEAAHGPRFRVPRSLRQMAREGRRYEAAR